MLSWDEWNLCSWQHTPLKPVKDTQITSSINRTVYALHSEALPSEAIIVWMLNFFILFYGKTKAVVLRWFTSKQYWNQGYSV